MPKLARVSGEQAIRALEKLGFVRVRQRGSHVVLKWQTNKELKVASFAFIASWPKALCAVSFTKPR